MQDNDDMKLFTVHFEGMASQQVKVSAHEGEWYQAIDDAEAWLLKGLCPGCERQGINSGIQRQWPDIMDAVEITDSNGDIAWSEPEKTNPLEGFTIEPTADDDVFLYHSVCGSYVPGHVKSGGALVWLITLAEGHRCA